tara:strand:- start:1295 stop:1699 length:405 start_codon:yes stop_codon:yes gene_type:complete
MSGLYGLARAAFLGGDIAWDTDDIRCVLVDTADYTVNIDVDEFLSDVPAGARVATSGAFTSPTVTLGVADAADIVLSSVTGDVSEAIVIYVHTGVDSTARLIAYIDSATGLPVTPNGGDITIQWDNGANKIFKL